MLCDYASASRRHLQSAQFLLLHNHYDNAAYLSGYVAECALKAVIEIAGRPPKIHSLDILGNQALVLAADLSYAARRYHVDLNSYLVMLQKNWTSGLRYSTSGFIQKQNAEDFVENARQLYGVTIGAMILDGLLERPPR